MSAPTVTDQRVLHLLEEEGHHPWSLGTTLANKELKELMVSDRLSLGIHLRIAANLDFRYERGLGPGEEITQIGTFLRAVRDICLEMNNPDKSDVSRNVPTC